MKNVLVTGANGFIGRNLCEALSRRSDVQVITFDVDTDFSVLRDALKKSDYVYHLAGVNRPKEKSEFVTGNVDLTKDILKLLCEYGKKPIIVFSSSTQAELDNDYGKSKKQAEDSILKFGKETGSQVFVYRLANVFGKWCRPNYNSVVATFCYNISHELDIVISDRSNIVNLVYIDDVVSEFISILDGRVLENKYLSVGPIYKVSLGELADKIYEIRDIRKTLKIPSLKDELIKRLHSTYISYLDKNDFSYRLDIKRDDRGSLAELIKSEYFGQIFISKTFGHITRGNHYHNTKIEKFCVIQGKAAIKFRNIFSDEVITYRVSGEDFTVLDIPPGYTHSIENLSDQEMIVLFWSNEIFNKEKPDTYFKGVEREKN